MRNNVIDEESVERDKIICPSLKIKLGLLECNLWTRLIKNSLSFQYLANKLPEKLTAGIFDGSQMNQLIKEQHFTKSVTEINSVPWIALLLKLWKIKFSW